MSRKMVMAAASKAVEKNLGVKPAVINSSVSRNTAHEQFDKLHKLRSSESEPASKKKAASLVNPNSVERDVTLDVRCFDHDVKVLAGSKRFSMKAKASSGKLPVTITQDMIPESYQPFSALVGSVVSADVQNNVAVLDLDVMHQIDPVDAGKVTTAIKLVLPSVFNKREYYELPPIDNGFDQSELDRRFSERVIERLNMARPYFGQSLLSCVKTQTVQPILQTEIQTMGFGFKLPPEALADLALSMWLTGIDRRKFLVAASSPAVNNVSCSVEMRSIHSVRGTYDIYAFLTTTFYDCLVRVVFT